MTETPEVDIARRIEQFIAVRDRLAEIDAAHDKARKPLLDVKDRLSGYLLEFLEKSGGESIRTVHGTCYATIRSTASLADPDAFMKFVVENEKFELLDRRANATAVKDYVEEHEGHLPPGVNLNQMKTVGVRRPA